MHSTQITYQYSQQSTQEQTSDYNKTVKSTQRQFKTGVPQGGVLILSTNPRGKPLSGARGVDNGGVKGNSIK